MSWIGSTMFLRNRRVNFTVDHNQSGIVLQIRKRKTTVDPQKGIDGLPLRNPNELQIYSPFDDISASQSTTRVLKFEEKCAVRHRQQHQSF